MFNVDTSKWKAADKPTPCDELLLAYAREYGGITFAEVPVGKDIFLEARRIDGVRLPSPGGTHKLLSYGGNRENFEKALRDAAERERESVEVEVIEITPSIERGVFGQAILGAWLLGDKYPKIRVKSVVVFANEYSSLKEFCDKHGIFVWNPAKQTRTTGN